MKHAEGRYYDAMHNPPFPQESGALTLDGPVGPLDVVVDLPEADVAVQPVVAIVCHPLSTEGGSMHNKVVTMAARSLRDLGIDPTPCEAIVGFYLERYRRQGQFSKPVEAA